MPPLRNSWRLTSLIPAVTFVILVSQSGVEAKVKDAQVSSENGFAYVAKFTFDVTGTNPPGCYTPTEIAPPQSAQVTFEVGNPVSGLSGMQLYLFTDEADSWPAVWRPRPGECHQRTAIFGGRFEGQRTGHVPCDGKINITSGDRWAPPVLAPGSPFTFTRVIHVNARPRTFYVALGHVDCTPFTDISIKVTLQNPGDSWHSEFGVNEQGLNTLYLVFFVAYCVLCGLQLYSSKLYRLNFHLPKMLTKVLLIEWISTVLFCAHFLTYTSDGVGWPLAKFFAEVLQALSQLVMLLLLVLLAQGWTIVRQEVQQKELLKVMICVLGLSTFLILLWGEYPADTEDEREGGLHTWMGRDAASTRYIYEETPGFPLLCVELLAAAVFFTTIKKTIKQCKNSEQQRDKDQRPFLIHIAIVFGCYLMVVPVVVSICSIIIDPWVEEFFVRLIEMVANFCANATLVYLIWPSREGNHFLASTGLETGLSGEPGSSSSQDSSSDIQLQAMKP